MAVRYEKLSHLMSKQEKWHTKVVDATIVWGVLFIVGLLSGFGGYEQVANGLFILSGIVFLATVVFMVIETKLEGKIRDVLQHARKHRTGSAAELDEAERGAITLTGGHKDE